VCHRTATAHVRCAISFNSWRSRPLQLRASWRTGHCPVHTGQSGAPSRPLARATRRPRIVQPTVGAGHASPTDYAADRCAGDHWLTGQSGAPPDSPMNYSCTPPKFPESGQFAGDQPGAPNTDRCTTGLSGVPDCAESWLHTGTLFQYFFSCF
jgi:hypothetical protein